MIYIILSFGQRGRMVYEDKLLNIDLVITNKILSI